MACLTSHKGTNSTTRAVHLQYERLRTFITTFEAPE
jgi:hypothetical protein